MSGSRVVKLVAVVLLLIAEVVSPAVAGADDPASTSSSTTATSTTVPAVEPDPAPSSVPSSSTPPARPPGQSRSAGSGCPSLSGEFDGGTVTGTKSLDVQIPAGVTVVVTGSVTDMAGGFLQVPLDSWALDPLVSGAGPGKGKTISVDESWTNTGGAQNVTVEFKDPSGFAFHYSWDLSLSWPGCGSSAGVVDADMLIGGGGPATPCVPCVVGDAAEAVAQMVAAMGRFKVDPVDTARGALVESVTDLSVAARGPGLGVSRTYDSAAAADGRVGLFGRGWSSLFDSSLTVTSAGGTDTAVWRQPSGASVSFTDVGTGWVADSSAVTATVAESAGQFSVGTDDGTVFGFEAGTTGVLRLVEVVDRNGYVLSLGWSAGALTVSARSAPGSSAPVAASLSVSLSAGRVVSVIDDAGRGVDYSYSGDLLVGVSSLGGGSWSYSYDAAGRLTNLVDPTGAETVNAYGTDGRVAVQWDPNVVAAGGGLDPADGTRFSYAGFDVEPLSGTVTVTSPDGAVESVVFENGLVISDTRGVGTSVEATWEFVFDPVSGLPVSATDPNRGVTSFTYDLSGRWLASVTTPEGRVTTYGSFDAFGNPGTVTDPAGTTTSITYDDNGNVTSSSTPWKTSGGTSLGADAATTYTRDSVRPDDVSSVTGPDGVTSSFTYTDAGLVASATDGAGGVSTFGYDVVGHQVWSVSPEGNKTGGSPLDHRGVVLVDAAGNVLSSASPKATGMADGFIRSSSGGLGVAATGEAWSSVSGSWSAGGGVASVAGAGIATVAAPGGSVDGLTIESVVPSGVAGAVGVVFRYQDASNYWTAVADGGSLVVSNTVGGVTSSVVTVPDAAFGPGDRIGAFSNATAVLVARNGRTLWGATDSTLGSASGVGLWSAAAGPVSAGFVSGVPTGGLTSSFFDEAGRLVGTSGPRGNLGGFWATTREFDAVGNLVSMTDENGLTTQQGFDVMGRMVSRTDPSGAVTGWSYDVLGRVVSRTAPGKPAVTVAYASGDYSASPVVPATRVVTGADGVTATTEFTGDGLAAGVDYSDATASVLNTFDALGRLTGSSGAVATSRAYDTLGQTLSVTRAGRTMGYSYDRPGRLTGLTYPNGEVVTRGYDSAGRWVSVSDWDAKTTTFAYDADGNVAQMVMPNGIETTWSRDANGAVVGIDYSGADGDLVVDSPRGNNSELLSVSGPGAPTTWTYDPAQQLTDTSNPAAGYTFDDAAHPTKLGGQYQTFNTAGELCWTASTAGTCGTPPSGATVYTYDANGQRTGQGSDSYAYDATGMMTSASTAQGTAGYTYSADGLRVSKTVGAATTVFAWDDTAAVPELIQDGNNYYLYGPGGVPIERAGADPTRWLHTDAIGSVFAITDDNGTVAGSCAYDAWGNPIGQNGETVGLGWQAQYQDPETGFYYLRHRYYDPATAQFTTPDPMFSLSGDRYGYAYNDPINGSDPTGLWCPLGKNPNGSCRGSGVAHRVEDVGTAVVNAPVTASTAAVNSWTGGDCDWNPHLTVVCYGGWVSDRSDRTFTTGSTVNTTLTKNQFSEIFGGHLLRHETAHTRQWAAFTLAGGPGLFPLLYGLEDWRSGGDACKNIFEQQAGLRDGGYTSCSCGG